MGQEAEVGGMWMVVEKDIVEVEVLAADTFGEMAERVGAVGLGVAVHIADKGMLARLASD